MTHEIAPINSSPTPESTSPQETIPASAASKDTMLDLVERLTAAAPEERHGMNDTLKVGKKASYVQPDWGTLELFIFTSRGAYSGRGLAELHITRFNKDGSQTLLAITLDGQSGSLGASVEEFELTPLQAQRGIRPDTWRELVLYSPPADDIHAHQRHAVDLALGTLQLAPSREGELFETEANEVNTALGAIFTQST
jgi:hypothetical protein